MVSKMTGRKAFTLIEVLVVVAILLVLAAIVLSATAQSRRSGHTAACTSNLRQAAQALEMYLQEGDGQLPYTLYHDFTPILPYLGDASVLACPLDPYRLGANWQSTRATGKRTSFTAPLTISPRFMRHLTALDPNHGVFACQVHGVRETIGVPSIDPLGEYRGLVLRVRKDTSVQRRQVRERCFLDASGSLVRHKMYWDLFTDEPMPREVQDVLLAEPGAREVPCP